MQTKKKFLMTKQGLPLGHDTVKTVEDARVLSNRMYQSGHYPPTSVCFAAGINGDWENGVCPIYRDDPSECSCVEEFGEDFDKIIEKEKTQTQPPQKYFIK